MNIKILEQRAKAFDYLFDAVVVTDLQGIITDWNKGSETLYGYSKEEAIGQPVNILHAPEDSEHITSEVISAVEKSGKWSGEVRMLHKDGHIGWIESMCVPIFDDNDQMVGALGINRDITERKQNDIELKQHEKHLEELVTQRSKELERQSAIIENLYDCKISTDLKGFITEWNKGAEDLYGYSANEAVGQNVSLIYPPGDLEVLEQQVITPLTEQGTHETEVRALRKNGDIFSAHLLLSMLYDNSGKPIGMTGYTKDISDRKQIEEALKASEQRLKLALQAASAGVWSWDIATNDAFWSVENFQVMGLDPATSESNYETWLQSVHPDDREKATKQVEEAVCNRTNLNIEFRVVWPNGKVVWINDIGNMIFNDKHEPIGMYGLQIDITGRKNTEVTLLNSIQEAQRANQAKTDFLASMSHELRTPLNSILGFAQLFEGDENSQLTEEQDGYIREIITAGNHLLELINQVLDLSSIEAGHLNIHIEPLIFKNTLTSCISQINAGLATSKNIQLIDKTNDSSSIVLSDPLRLKQVIINLLNNAVKYNKEGGSVTIESKTVAGNKLQISVIDTGKGISQEDITKLFDPFERLSFKHGGIEGSGIGLTVAKQLVEAMQGTIGVESTLGKGSTFWIELPLAS